MIFSCILTFLNSDRSSFGKSHHLRLMWPFKPVKVTKSLPSKIKKHYDWCWLTVIQSVSCSMLQKAAMSSAVIRQQDSPRLAEYQTPSLDFYTVLHLLPFSPISTSPSISLILMTACLEIWKLMIDTPISFLPAHAKAPISQGPLFLCASGEPSKRKNDWKDISSFG